MLEQDDDMGARVEIDAAGVPYRELNTMVRAAIVDGARHLILTNVRGQRFIADGLREKSVRLEIHGIPGGDLAAFMDGPTVHVHGNCQDAVANTMNDGTVCVHGHAGDALGYGMRGGRLLVRDDAGYRVGIHMKAFKDQAPQVVIGGCVGDFLGEYLAGGTLVILGMGRQAGQALVGGYVASGMHGGTIYLRGAPHELPTFPDLAVTPVTGAELQPIMSVITHFCRVFGFNPEEVLSGVFTRLTPLSHRPFAAKYVPV